MTWNGGTNTSSDQTMMPFFLALVALPLTLGHDPLHDPDTGGHGGHHHDVDEPSWKRPAASATPVYVGSGAHRYRWDAEWMKLPEGRDWLGSTHGCIVIDRSDRVYLSAEQGPAVLAFTRDGKLAFSFGEEWGPGLHGISLVTELRDVVLEDGERSKAAREVLYLAHTARREVYKTGLQGDLLLTIAAPPVEAGLYSTPDQYKPTSVAVGPDGTIFVADGYGLSWVHRYSSEGVYLDSFGGLGDQPQHLKTPHGLWMDQNTSPHSLLVADRENHRLARFDLAGNYLDGTDPDSGLLRRPCHIQFHGKLGAVSDLAGRTTLLNPDLDLVMHLGDNPDPAQRAKYNVIPDLWREGVFFAPHCARFNSTGDLFVMDWNVAGRVTRLVHAPEKVAEGE